MKRESVAVSVSKADFAMPPERFRKVMWARVGQVEASRDRVLMSSLVRRRLREAEEVAEAELGGPVLPVLSGEDERALASVHQCDVCRVPVCAPEFQRVRHVHRRREFDLVVA